MSYQIDLSDDERARSLRTLVIITVVPTVAAESTTAVSN